MTATTDIHFHLLPGVDDGPPTMADSLELAAAAVRDGCSTVVATPHVGGTSEESLARLADRVAAILMEFLLSGAPPA